MEQLILYPKISWPPLDVEPFNRMTKNRASRGAKLSSITFVNLRHDGSREEVLKLNEHVAHVECRAYGVKPDWDDVPGVNRMR